MKILLLGPQGCGKGTVGDMMSRELGMPHIASGDLLRAVPPEDPDYKEINDAMNAGIPVPQHLVAKILRTRFSQPDCSRGYILEGWFRARRDLEVFDIEPDLVLVINISRETSIRRISGRRLCTSDGKTYNIYTLPKEELKKCTGELTQRKDDTEEAVKVRLGIYYTETQEVIKILKDRGTKVIDVDGEGTPDQVLENVMKVLTQVL